MAQIMLIMIMREFWVSAELSAQPVRSQISKKLLELRVIILEEIHDAVDVIVNVAFIFIIVIITLRWE